jgi:methylated-DNA-protein-cysteine methyltransferase-like protein
MEEFRRAVLDVVRAVPEGSVTTYGTVALLAGKPRHARQVGAILYGLRDSEEDVPWQRVINASGGISTFKVGSGELQVALLRSEGVVVTGRKVDLDRFGWRQDGAWLPH